MNDVLQERSPDFCHAWLGTSSLVRLCTTRHPLRN